MPLAARSRASPTESRCLPQAMQWMCDPAGTDGAGGISAGVGSYGSPEVRAEALGSGLILNLSLDLVVQGTKLFLECEDEGAQVREDAEQPRVERGEFLPEAWAPPTMGKRMVTVLGDLAMTPIGKASDLTAEELATTSEFTSSLLGFSGDANGREFIAIAIEPAGETETKSTGIEFVGLALGIEGNGGDEKALGTGLDELTVKDKAKAAGFVNANDLEAVGDPAFDLCDEFEVGELTRGLGVGVIFLSDGHDEGEVNVEAELEKGLLGIEDSGGKGLARWNGRGLLGRARVGFGSVERTEGVESAIALSGGLWLGAHVMNGLEVWFFFHRECVPVGHAHSTHHDILTALPRSDR